MTASRQVAPPLGVPALSSLPGVAGSWNGSLQLAPPPPQWPAVSKRVRQDSRERQSALDRRLLPGAGLSSCAACDRPVVSQGGEAPRPGEQRRNVSDTARQHLSTLPNSNYPASCHLEREGNIAIPIL